MIKAEIWARKRKRKWNKDIVWLDSLCLFRLSIVQDISQILDMNVLIMKGVHKKWVSLGAL